MSATAPERSAPLEIRLAGGGRTLAGEAVRYGRLNPRAAPGQPARTETFMAGSIEPAFPVRLTLQHDDGRELATTADQSLRLHDSDTALRIEADLRDGSAELDLVRRGALRGLSVEFHSLQETVDGGVRVLQRAAVPTISLVDIGSHESSVELRVAEARAADVVAILTSVIPAGVRLRCECSGPSCHFAEFDDGALDAMALTIASGDVETLATWASYDRPLGSSSMGRVRAERTAAGLAVAIDIPDTDDGRALLDASETSGIVVRPYLVAAESDSTIEGTGESAVRRYRSATVRSLVVSATDAREGWDRPQIERRAASAAILDRRLLLL